MKFPTIAYIVLQKERGKEGRGGGGGRREEWRRRRTGKGKRKEGGGKGMKVPH